MPEGDTIHRLAGAMSPRLIGVRIERVEMEHIERPALSNTVVTSVEARGKHLLIGLGERYLRSHLGLNGSWHRYPRDARWKRPASQASLVLHTAEDTYVCFNAKEVDCIKASRMALHRPLRRLGVDLVSGGVDFDQIVARARALLPEAALAKVVLDQRVASGIGNVYKSEVLFMTGRHPSTRLDLCDDDSVVEIYRMARDLLRANVHRAHRVTTDTSAGTRTKNRLWVYRRAGRQCLRCETDIQFARMHGRSTYWCPSCQPTASARLR